MTVNATKTCEVEGIANATVNPILHAKDGAAGAQQPPKPSADAESDSDTEADADADADAEFCIVNSSVTVDARPTVIANILEGRDVDNVCLQDLFMEQAKRTSDATAVVDGDVELTYRELDLITNDLAVTLHRDFHVRPDSVVGILLPRSVEYVIAYVSILKAGGAYMPLELVYPKQLLERAMNQTKANLVITGSTYQTRVDQHPHHLLDRSELPSLLEKAMDNDGSDPDRAFPQDGLQPRPNADSLAFCVMSSGTTGTPKGICQTHRSAVHSYCDRFSRYPYHRRSASSNPTSDDDSNNEGVVEDRVGAGVFFVWELYRPLCQGAACVIIPDTTIFDPEAVTNFVQDQGITRILFTPSLLQLIMDTIEPAEVQNRLRNLRYLWLCGEVVTTELACAFSNLLPHVEFLNLYSISECHDVSIGDLKRDLKVNQKYATCGPKIPGVQFYIVDVENQDAAAAGDESGHKELKLVSEGNRGEVYVGGPVVGRGYLHLPEKTKERFVPNPFSDKYPRLYRTGDLGRLLPTGDLEILGRCDFMVKIRGYSVVLGAVEAALAKHPKLCSAVVLAVGAEGTDKKLVAYVVPAHWDDAPSASSVRTFLKDHLPPYAIPSTFCVIDALPVNASAAGKLDRKKLPNHETAPRLRAFSVSQPDDVNIADALAQAGGDASGTTGASAGRKNNAPATDMEAMVLAAFSKLVEMPVEELSITDSFFDVGGHSLLATRLVQLLNEHVHKNNAKRTDGSNGAASSTPTKVINIVDVMQYPAARDLAGILEERLGASCGDSTKAVAAAASKTPQVDLEAEAQSLDPSIYPFATRKGHALSRFRMEDLLMKPQVTFLTGATGYLGVHILAELLRANVVVICLARASDDDAAFERIVKNLKRYSLLDEIVEQLFSDDEALNTDEDAVLNALSAKLIAIAGDLSRPLLGLDAAQFKSLALEADSIIHCGAEVNLVKPYQSLKQSNVLGTQEILRLATTNGLIKTKVKPVHYISTNGIFPVDRDAYKTSADADSGAVGDGSIVLCKEDVAGSSIFQQEHHEHLDEGYSMTKWVAERMCSIAEARGLPISILRPGNMAGSVSTGAQNPDDFNYLFLKAMIQLKCAPTASDTAYFLDMTPVDFAAKAVVQVTVNAPGTAIGQRMHLQNSAAPVPLSQIVEWLKEIGYGDLEPVTTTEWMNRVRSMAAKATREGGDIFQRVESGWEAFEMYFTASSWLHYDSRNLTHALKGTGLECPALSPELLRKWFPDNQE